MLNSARPYIKAISSRLAAGLLVFLLVTFGATALSSLAPGSAAQLILGDYATPEQIATLNSAYGYDLPVWQRYLNWLGDLLHGDLGVTLFSQQPVIEVVFERAAVTFEIAFLALARQTQTTMPLTALAAEIHRLLAAAGLGGEDQAALMEYFSGPTNKEKFR